VGKSGTASAPASTSRDRITGQNTKDVQPKHLLPFEGTDPDLEAMDDAEYTKSSHCSGHPGYIAVHSEAKQTRTYAHVHALLNLCKRVISRPFPISSLPRYARVAPRTADVKTVDDFGIW
jgi:hypothetical protein